MTVVAFDNTLHTPEALSAEIDTLYARAPETLLVGSLGRAILFGLLSGSQTTEFDYRGQTPEGRLGMARDIDAIDAHVDDSSFVPYPLDNTVFSNDTVELVHEGSQWHLVSRARNFAEPIRGEVMAPVEGKTVFSIPARTVPLSTLVALHGINGIMRDKDQDTLLLMHALVDLQDSKPLPEAFYEPFERLREMNARAFATKMRRLYRGFVPLPIRTQLLPVTRAIKTVLH